MPTSSGDYDITSPATSPKNAVMVFTLTDPTNQLASNDPNLTFNDDKGGSIDDQNGDVGNPVTFEGGLGPFPRNLTYTPPLNYVGKIILSFANDFGLIDPPAVTIAIGASVKHPSGGRFPQCPPMRRLPAGR